MHDDDQKLKQSTGESVSARLRKPPPPYHGSIKERKGKTFSTTELEQIRSDLDLTVEDFARLLGLSFMTVYNWEKGAGMVEVSDIQARILTVLSLLTTHKPDMKWAEDVGRAVTKQGGLYGLYRLLGHYYQSVADQAARRSAPPAP